MQQADHRSALLNLGFRPFFAGAGIFSVVLILVWMTMTITGWQPDNMSLPAATWHAHEMIYGYSLAVIAGFLLTAVRNWTGERQYLRQASLYGVS